MRNSYLIYDLDYIPEHLVHAYQYNSWLFDMVKFGISFYAMIIAVLLYLLVFVMSTCISCRIQMSPGWKYRYQTNNSYDLLNSAENNNCLLRNNKIKQDTITKSNHGLAASTSKNNTVRSSKIYNKRDSDGGFSSKHSFFSGYLFFRWFNRFYFIFIFVVIWKICSVFKKIFICLYLYLWIKGHLVFFLIKYML